MISTNLDSVYNMTKNVIEHMIANKSSNIINISSIWGLTGGSMEVAYSASKAGMDGFAKALAKELGPSGIRVNSIACGLIDTKMNDYDDDEMRELIAQIPLGRIGKPTDVANAVVFLASSKADFITGSVLNLTGGHYC